jgi:PilZ domain
MGMNFVDLSNPDVTVMGDSLNAPERRTDSRVQTVFRVARVITATDEGLARIRNISDQGARLRMLITIPIWDCLILQLADGVDLSGRVVWREGDEFGLQFDQPISCSDLLATLAAGAKSGRTRPVRLPVETVALTRSECGLRSAKVVDISQRGLKLAHDGSLTEGLHLKVTLPSGLDRSGIVRWSNDSLAGIMLLEPLGFEALGSAKNLLLPSAPEVWLPNTAGGSSKS